MVFSTPTVVEKILKLIKFIEKQQKNMNLIFTKQKTKFFTKQLRAPIVART